MFKTLNEMTQIDTNLIIIKGFQTRKFNYLNLRVWKPFTGPANLKNQHHTKVIRERTHAPGPTSRDGR